MILSTKIFSYEERVRVFWTLIFISTVCLVVYVLAVNFAVRNTIARQTLEIQTANLSAHIGELEFSYISLKNKVSLDLAYKRGFKEVVVPVYIGRASSRALSMNVPTNQTGLVNR